MDDWEALLYLDEPYNVLICRRCHAGVEPGLGLKSHFRGRHRILGQPLQQLLLWCALRGVVDFSTCPLPEDGRPVLDELPVLAGYRCTQCRYYSQSWKEIELHWRKAGHREDGAKWQEARLQTWGMRNLVRYWEVADDAKPKVKSEKDENVAVSTPARSKQTERDRSAAAPTPTAIASPTQTRAFPSWKQAIQKERSDYIWMVREVRKMLDEQLERQRESEREWEREIHIARRMRLDLELQLELALERERRMEMEQEQMEKLENLMQRLVWDDKRRSWPAWILRHARGPCSWTKIYRRML